MIPLLRKKSWKDKVKELARFCEGISGTYIPDEDEKVFACIDPDRRLNVTYFRERDMFIVSLSRDGVVMSVATPDMPDFSYAEGGFTVTVDKPEVAKVYTTTE